MERKELEHIVSRNTAALDMVRTIPQCLLERAIIKRYSVGETVVRHGAPVMQALFILTGETSVSISTPDGRISTYLVMRAPTVVSDLEILAGRDIYIANVTARTDCTLLICGAEEFRRELHHNVELLWKVSAAAAGNNFNMAFESGQVVYRTGLEKMACYLVRCYEEGRPDYGGGVTVYRNQQEIASELTLSVKTVGRSMAQLRELGCVSVVRKKCHISTEQYQMLQKISQGG